METPASFLPPDEVIYERSKTWSNFITRVVNEENFQSMYLEEIPSPDELDDEDSEGVSNENTPVNDCRALVKANDFEGDSSSDEFDVNDLLSETLPIIEERKRKWRESGMDKVLDTFDLKAITSKVGSWLEKAKLEKSLTTNSSYEDAHIMHFEDHQVHLNSDDSLQSADTAKYILSNRKRKATSCTTMTIKRFRYVKRKQKQLQDRHNFLNNLHLHKDFDAVFDKNSVDCCPSFKNRIATGTNCDGLRCSRLEKLLTPSRVNMFKKNFVKQEEIFKQSINHRRRSRQRIRRPDTLKKRSSSSSSSSSSTPKRTLLKSKPKFRKVPRDSRNQDRLKQKQNADIISITDDSDVSVKEITHRRPGAENKKRAIIPENDLDKNIAITKLITESEITCFLPDNIVNSTASATPKVRNHSQPKRCQLSPITNTVHENNDSPPSTKHLRKSVSTDSKSVGKVNSTPDIDSSFRKIVVYTPKEKALHSKSIVNDTFVLTQDQLRKSIGNKAARRFITFNAKKFPFKFNAASTVYFKRPIEKESTIPTDTSSDSEEEDVLEIFGKEGELVEEPM